MAVRTKRRRNRIIEIRNGKRVKKELCRDVLELIFKKLNFLDLANSKLVCCSWNSIAKHVQTCYVPHKKVPSLLVPPLIYGDNFSLCDIEDKRNYNVKTNMGFAYSEDQSCYEVGSSHGCLIFLDKKFVPFVLNPFTGSKLELPEFTDGEVIFTLNSLDIEFIIYDIPSYIREQIEGKSPTQSWLRYYIARKVILSSNPFGDNKFSAVIIYGDQQQLAYFNIGQAALTHLDAWTHLDPENKHYSDAMFDENKKLYAVETDTTCVEAWDFSGSIPVKFMKLEPEIPLELWETYHIYLVKLSGRILLVTRNVGGKMDDDGNGVIDEQRVIYIDGVEMLVSFCPKEVEGSDGEEVIGPDHRIMNHNEDDEEEEKGYKGHDWYVQEPHPPKYRTVSFDVFELDMQKQQWVELNSLEGCAIFLGGNHTISVSTHQQEFASLEDGAIYFTDDNWGRMCANSCCGGHDRGVFNIRDNKVKVCDGYGFSMMKPSPCWIVANPW